ncbi:MAG: hypothetical protein HYU66_10240 [Armatimonadetes bacterium]|nr:hypothetical protein [Armatimonadota bacterium]
MSDSAAEIGSRLELFVDDFLVESLSGGARRQLHQPVRREVVLRTDAPWEGNACGYASVVSFEGGYRLYYHALQYRDGGPATEAREAHPALLCCVESHDGLTWRRPELGLVEHDGSRANNIVLAPGSIAAVACDPAHTAVLRDENPDCPPTARFKIVAVGWQAPGLFVLQSPDGLRFSLAGAEPVCTEGAFDSQNLMFWDPLRREYREYHRGFRDGQRDILTAASPDPLHFPAPQWLEYPGAPPEQLYTNQITPYYRAPHLFLGFPARYTERDWDTPLFDLPGLEERLCRARHAARYGSAITDTVLMSSRDGHRFQRWPEAFLRPGPRRHGSWVYGDNYLAWGMIETPSAVAGAPPEISLYASDGYWENTFMDFRRYTLRVDGFVSVRAPLAGGELLTRPVVFEGGGLALNLETSAAGGVRVGLLDPAGLPVPGYGVDDCPEIMGDSVRHRVRWREHGGDLRALAGRPVRLHFRLRDADLYSFQFVAYAPEPGRPDLAGITLP